MQIDRDHLTVLNDTRVQDGHHEIWEQDYVAGLVAAEVDARDINTVRGCHLTSLYCILPAEGIVRATLPQKFTGDARGQC